MQLYYSALSPFARKVQVVAHEAGLAGKIDLVVINPWTDDSLRARNPLSQVPTLITDDGLALYDSAVICDYLDAIGDSGLIPLEGAARWRALRLQALADGLGDAAVSTVRERQRPAAEQRAGAADRALAALAAGLDALEAEGLTAEQFLIGEIAVAVQLAYFDVREVLDWRAGRPGLAAWFEGVSKLSAMVDTAPKLA